MPKNQVLTEHSILLFDGYCQFCQFWVNFIMRHEKEQSFFFAPIDSNVGRKLRQRYQISNEVDSDDRREKRSSLSLFRSRYSSVKGITMVCENPNDC